MTGFLICDAAGLAALAAGGEIGWLLAWLDAGQGAQLLAFDAVDWHRIEGRLLVVATEERLRRAAVAQGKRLVAAAHGAMELAGAERIDLSDPPRIAWAYRFAGGRALLVPPGGLAFDRARWQSALAEGAPRRRWVWPSPNPHADEVEPGVAVSCERPCRGFCFSDDGMPPEVTLVNRLRAAGVRLRLAESCTAGWAAGRVARVPGASDVLDRGWIVYANAAKRQLLQVPGALLEAHGAVSREVVEAMARAGSDSKALCVAISGIAGPSGGTRQKPVGTVWFAAALGSRLVAECVRFAGGRNEVRTRAAIWALALALRLLSERALDDRKACFPAR